MAETMRIYNPFPPVNDGNARILILGSLPSEASRAAGFYYMNPRNRFWTVLSALLDEDFAGMPIDEKRAALSKHGVALSDVVLSCEIHRSSDASIKNPECTDVPALVGDSKIKRIFLNGQKAYALFLKFFPSYKEMATLLPSTSPANAKTPLAELTRIWGKAILPFLQA